jgi:hypothetical protein
LGLPTVFDPSFKGVGQAPGLEIWRVEKLAVVKKAASDKCYKGHLHEGDSYIILQTKVRTALALHPARDRGYVQNKRYQFSLTKSPFCWLWAFFFPHCLHTALWLTLLRLSFDCGLGVSTAVVKREKVVVFAVLHLSVVALLLEIQLDTLLLHWTRSSSDPFVPYLRHCSANF